MGCRKPKSIAVKREIAKVFVAWRHERFSAGGNVIKALSNVTNILKNRDIEFEEARRCGIDCFSKDEIVS